LRHLVLMLITILLCVSPVHAREIMDMTGKNVSVPDKITKVFSGTPSATYMIYAIDPALLSGLNLRIAKEAQPYLDKKMQSLPVLGGFFGQGNIANAEMILKTDPDLVILWADKGGSLINKNEEMIMKNLPIPAVHIVFEGLYDYGEAFLFLGRLFGKEERAGVLKRYADDTLKTMNQTLTSIPANKRPTVYYAEGTDGLNTDCDGSWHAELINVAGAKNVYHCAQSDNLGMEKVNIEQVMTYNPDVIIVQERAFFDSIFKDPKWQNIKAVKTKRVYLIPRIPFNWFDRPPSFMRLMGIQWLMHCLYPEEYSVDIVMQAKEFFRLFLGVDKTDEEIRKVVCP
jgi:iron complex transport system substrate-binding protein